MEDDWFRSEKYNVKIFERFRAACDVYFEKKSEFYKAIKSDMEKTSTLNVRYVRKPRL